MAQTHRGGRVRRRANLKIRCYNGHREERGSFAEVLEAEVADDDFDTVSGAEALGELFG
jgi:hypothetical protein